MGERRFVYAMQPAIAEQDAKVDATKLYRMTMLSVSMKKPLLLFAIDHIIGNKSNYLGSISNRTL